ncbi:inner membrane protein [Haloarcula quadrata]|uniref:Inner membrane protein n=1 Tax=Haloarcula quadrata TaxID=182779 RepID=A0A495QQM3_9EURY|nr:metal-dependent hydrolase [Haloarcula quadrata]RKS75794.1 inner membrane protein [Haloarcula quadrata]
MHRPGHYGTALICYAPIAVIVMALGVVEMAVAGGAIVVGGAMLPDYDQRVPGISHRGPTHTVWFALAVGAVLGGAGALIGGVIPAVVGGVSGVLLVLAHLLADVLTPMGIRPFAPVRDTRYTLDVGKAANPVANYALLVVGILVAGTALYAGRMLTSLS